MLTDAPLVGGEKRGNSRMEFFHRAAGLPRRLGILPGTFNPITVAHLALAGAGLSACDEVVFVLPRVFPHKHFTGASFDQRLAMLEAAVAGQSCYSIAACDGGLFVEIAAECRRAYGTGTALTFLCGRDAAERIAGWDYGDAAALPAMLRQFDLLVANRSGDYVPPAHLREAIATVRLSSEVEFVSATEVRARIARGERWEHLVPAAVHESVRRIYAATGPEPPGTSPRY
jgi:nicotinate-nucleotide adenylyltransferase